VNRFEGLAKPSTFTAGALFVAGGLLDQVIRFTAGNIGDVVQTPVYAARSLALLAGALLLMLSLVSLYVRRARQIGRLGFSAAIVAGTGTILMAGLFWAQAFLYPTLGRLEPGLLDGSDRPGSFAFGLLLTSTVFGAGWILVGSAILRAHVYRVVPAVLIVIGGAASLFPGVALSQAVLGAGLVLLSFSPTYRKHEGPQRQSSPTR